MGACYADYRVSKEITVMKSECDLRITEELRGADLSAFSITSRFPKESQNAPLNL